MDGYHATVDARFDASRQSFSAVEKFGIAPVHAWHFLSLMANELTCTDDDVQRVHLILLKLSFLHLGLGVRPVQDALVAVDHKSLELVREHSLNQVAAIRLHDRVQGPCHI